MVDDWLLALSGSPWALPLLFALVFGDAFLVVVPGEAAVTAFGALGAATGQPWIGAVIVVAATGAFAGDVCLFAIGRRVGLARWAWMRRPRMSAALAWAQRRLERNAATVLFTARFVPFARIAVLLTAGASRVPARRVLPVAGAAACAWALHQAVLGAVVATLVPGGPVVAVVVSVATALVIGVLIDALIALREKRGRQARRPRRAK